MYVCENGCGYITCHKTKMTNHYSRKIPCLKKVQENIQDKNETDEFLNLLKSIDCKLGQLLDIAGGGGTRAVNNVSNVVVNKLLDYRNPNIPEHIYTLADSHDLLFIPNAIENIYFNTELPENHSITITNIRSNTAKVFNGIVWKTIDIPILINELVNMFELLFDEKNGIDPVKYSCIEKYRNKLAPDLETLIEVSIKRLLIDYRKLVKV